MTAKAIDSGISGGLALAIPSGATVTGALEAVPAVAVERSGAGIITSAAAGIRPPDDTVNLSFNRQTGESGKYRDTRKNVDGDGNHAHHMPSKKYLKDHGANPSEGFSAIMPEKLHYQTRTYGRGANEIDTNIPYRTEIGKDIADYMSILKKDGLWTPEVRKSFMKGLDDFKVEFPDLFKKINQQ